MIDAFLSRLHTRTIYGRKGPYMTKFRLLNLGKRFLRVYVHLIHRSDEDEELHSHPWNWAFGIILKGGYRETRWSNPNFSEDPYATGYVSIRSRTYLPGQINVIRSDDYHKLDLLEDECWTLFIAGPEKHEWFFANPWSGRRWPWREFIIRKGLVPA